MGLSVQVANFVRAINWCSSLSQRKCGEGKMVFLPKDICLCHSDRKSWWINQPGKKKGGGGGSENLWQRKKQWEYCICQDSVCHFINKLLPIFVYFTWISCFFLYPLCDIWISKRTESMERFHIWYIWRGWSFFY